MKTIGYLPRRVWKTFRAPLVGKLWVPISGANRNPKLRNSEFVQIPIWYLDGQRRIVSVKIGQPLNSDMPLKMLPMSFPKFIGNVDRLSSPRIRIYLTDQSGTEEYEKNVDNIVAKCITGINFCFTLATIICKFGQFLDRIMFRTVLDGQLTPTLDIGQTLDRHFLKLASLVPINYLIAHSSITIATYETCSILSIGPLCYLKVSSIKWDLGRAFSSVKI